MPPDLRPTETLFLWRLAAAGGGDWLKDVKPDPGSKERGRLMAQRLITSEKRKPPGGRAQAAFLSLTDAGWAWLGSHLDADLRTRSPVGAEVLQLVLTRLKTFLERENRSLGDLMAPGQGPAETPSPPAGELKARVTAAYHKLSSGRSNARVRIADLRRALESIPRSTFDAALLDLATTGEASLFRLDDPLEIHDSDREGLLRTPTGEERHVVYLGGRGS